MPPKQGTSRIILVGPGAAGKDYTRALFEKRGFKHAISHTTRPMREGEEDGVDYHFVDNHEFVTRIRANDFYEWTTFKNDEWYYGTSNDEFYSSNIFVMTPSGIAALKPEDRENSMVIYVDAPEEIRRSRLSERNDVDGVDRRMEADNKDFENFVDFDLRITAAESK